MSNDRSNGTGVSRRQLLGRATATVCGAAIAVAAGTQSAQAGQISPAAAGYQPMPKGDQRCDNCTLFQPPMGCKFVSGEISPQGWCKLYVKRS
ncbi:MAG: high-potential iron-sulfur protein [Proteobacteria bacterium]|nr:high-potential iron-sulfur protein [Pseudomonadota bacterium]